MEEESAGNQGSSSCSCSVRLGARLPGRPAVHPRGGRSGCPRFAEGEAEAPRGPESRPRRGSCGVDEPTLLPARRVPGCPLILSQKGLGRVYLN